MIYQIVNPLNGVNIIQNANVVKTTDLEKNEYPDSSMEEIFIDEALSYMTNEAEFQSVIQFALAKLRLGGSITITDLDLNVLCQETLQKKDKNRFNGLVNHKRYIHSWRDVKKIVATYSNIRVESVKIDGTYYIVRCTKI